MSLPLISSDVKLRILTMFGRYSLMTYVSRGSPALRVEEIALYGYDVPTSSISSSSGKQDPAYFDRWTTLVEKGVKIPDDGHSIKFLRALMNAERLCKQYEGEGRMMVTGDMYVKIGKMLIDAVGGDDIDDDNRWIRNVGFEEAWKDVPDRE